MPVVRTELGQSPAQIFGTATVQVEGEGEGEGVGMVVCGGTAQSYVRASPCRVQHEHSGFSIRSQEF